MSILSQNRIAAGVPTGGQFAGHDRADSAAALAEKPYTEALTEVLSDMQRRIESAQRYIAAQSITSKLRSMHPGGTTAKWCVDSAGRTRLVEVVDDAGRAIPPANHLGAYITPELNILGNDPITHLSKSGTAHHDAQLDELTFSSDLRGVDIERRRAEWAELTAVLPDEHLPMVAREALRSETRHAFPNAAVITITDQNVDGVGAPYYSVTAVHDTAGELIWDEWNPSDGYHFEGSVEAWAPLLDRDGRNDVTIKLHV